MVRDRLAEMQARGADSGPSPTKSETSVQNGTGPISSEDHLSHCLGRVSQVDDKIKKMRETISEMDRLQKNILTRPVLDKSEAKQLEKVSDSIFSMSTDIQKEINVFRQEMKSLSMDTHHEKIIENHLKRLSADTTKVSHEFRAAQVDYIEKTKKLHHKTLEIVTGGDDTKREELTLDPSKMQSMFAGDYMMEAAKARQELRDIEARDAEIKKIEGSVIEVNRLFKEINALIMEQGETIDNIEMHVNQASIDVVKSGEQLRQARQYQSGARRKKICCIGILIAIVVIAGVVVTIVLIQNNKKDDNKTN